ncbi:1-acyl-sn-glycerol-3-phosphate acyltransferase [Microbacterium sp. LRZ72]|uniref:lysophospholipid acyltransferase family protein n=1 Tax=Microbacterium sp. LRZ72 TaxID=2942481 RepID=UPI0029ABFF15|nr:lysophospholipid acyltransferase family protein [Microbacterium sp. LRZ72]MDX2375607.1 1-acyl-sn-glycerol-3-phosphate acyltransferase [Microbacterium sp. LRZ72]
MTRVVRDSPPASERARPSVFWLLAIFVVPVVGLFAKIEIEGAEKLPRRGAYVLAPNHYTEIDPLIVAVAVWRMGRAPRFLAKEGLFRVPVLGPVLRACGMVPVARTSSSGAGQRTLSAARELVENGRGVVVYPEGTLTRDPDMWPMRGKTGAVRLAAAGGIPVIPMAHWGTQQIMARYAKRISLWPPRKRVRIVLGDPISVSEVPASGAQPAVLAAATTRVMDAVTHLLEGLRGESAPPQRWNPAQHAQEETGRFES